MINRGGFSTKILGGLPVEIWYETEHDYCDFTIYSEKNGSRLKWAEKMLPDKEDREIVEKCFNPELQ